MQTIVTRVAWSVRVCVCVRVSAYLLVTTVALLKRLNRSRCRLGFGLVGPMVAARIPQAKGQFCGYVQHHWTFTLQLRPSVFSAPGVKQQIVVSLLLEISVIFAGVGRRKDALEVSASAVLADKLDQDANVVRRQFMQDSLLLTTDKFIHSFVSDN